MQHPYCYPGTDVLKNKHGIRDADDLEALERHLSFDRLKFLPMDIPITPAGYREIHRYMLQDVYEWAGQDRFIDTGRTGPFCRAQFIEPELNKRFAAINAENNLHGLTAMTFARRAAEHCGELNAIHPFLDGNGRTLRAFLERLGEQAGHKIDLTRIEPAFWNHASRVSYEQGDNGLMAAGIAGAIVTPERQQEAGRQIEPPEAEQDIDDLEL